LKPVLSPKAKKFIRKASQDLRDKVELELRKIVADPYKNPRLKGTLALIRSHRFTHKKTQYRIAYLVEDNVVVILIGTRENFYRDL